MTKYETIMLAICFGAVMGTFIANCITAIVYLTEHTKDKRRERRKKKEAEAAETREVS